MSKTSLIEKMLDRIKEQPRIALAIEGQAGMGKSAIVESWANENDIPVVKLLASTLSEEDIAGVIVADHESHTGEYYSLGLLDKVVKERTVLFLDELNTSVKETADALLTLIESRHLPDGTKLHPETIIVAAMNPAIAYGNYELSPAMRNRFAWVRWTQNAKEWWTNFGVEVPEDDDVRVMVDKLINEDGLMFTDDKGFTEETNVFTTPRSLTRLLQFATSVQDVKLFAPSFIGKDAVALIDAYKEVDVDIRGNSFFTRDKAEPVSKKTGVAGATGTSGIQVSSLHARLSKRIEERE